MYLRYHKVSYSFKWYLIHTCIYVQAGDSVALPSFRVQYFFTTFNNRNHTFSDCLRIWQNAVQGKVRLLHHHIAMVTCSHVCIMNVVGVRVEPRLCPFHCPLRVACLLLPSLWSISHLFALSGLLKMNVMQCIELWQSCSLQHCTGDLVQWSLVLCTLDV